jgi:hypothetical protein
MELPCSIAEENLTLCEIGAMVVLMASPNISWASKKLWDNDRNFVKTVESLQRQGIVSHDDSGRIVINIKSTQGEGNE